MAIITKIVPHLWYDTQAKEAAEFYVSVFPDSKIINTVILENTPSGNAEQVEFELMGQCFMAISAGPYFKFNEAVSFIINCDSQEEIDYYWEKLSAVPEAEQCGWVKDTYGLSWQIVPSQLDEMLYSGTKEQKKHVTQAFLKMKKFDIKKLQEAFNA